MVYIYKKIVGDKNYYYLRASKRVGKRLVTKDLAYLGSNIEDVKNSLKKVPKQEIRKAYKVINRFIESNFYLEKVNKKDLKLNQFIKKDLLEQIEACKLHWQKFKKIDEKTRDDFFKVFIIEFAFNTASIEGNTITLKETASLLKDNLTPKNKTLREVFDLQNTEKVFSSILKKPVDISHKSIINVHKDLMNNLDSRVGYRTENVRVFRAHFDASPVEYIKTDLDLLLKWFEKNKNIHPFILAGIFHHKFEKIHPFFDGNGRTGRVLLNNILLKNYFPPFVVQNKHRKEYLEVLSNADRSDLLSAKPEDYKPLLEFLAGEMIETYWNIFI